ncbi:hypothetical protein HNR23_004069 [Nocardiopsis mwathae]|uniref:Uncharacterized protein n=1 Tax=Nocardiopsis mwathae TaxID=1472723 RepID=A0A7W9YKU7_9ACTN|nr:hypothetical protein [Nocardiopsis mwathae]MBB6174009.1 hypothetical protein [Nocardiopsis mwathae]
MTDESGGNPNEGFAMGNTTVEISESFKGIAKKFGDVCADAKTASGSDPGVKGFSSFSDEALDTIRKVQHHGTQMGGNMIVSADSIAKNDQEHMTEFEKHAYGLNRRVNH